ncbi:MAG TPA: 3'(2'),5'-bisphosphate nucleotidase CysQ [Longimicrobiales bacterium]|nr:3'(2'),5'-bisphosphate nucleotidase CysQ [Longimicrobiales bacterium]
MPDRSAYAAELEVAIDAARIGGREVMARYGSTESETKAGGSPVTEADHASAAAIRERIRQTFPDDFILCEETLDDPRRVQASRLWVVDPLDGTREFLAQNGEFSIMIGLVYAGRPVLGVVYRPDGDALFAGVIGEGAWVERNGTRTPLHATKPLEGLRLVTSRSHSDAAVDAVARELNVTERRPSGSVGLKCALIAEGVADVYVHPVSYISEWDTCAPEAVLVAAGGVVTDCRGKPLEYNKPDPRQRFGILACAPGLLEQTLAAVARADLPLLRTAKGQG